MRPLYISNIKNSASVYIKLLSYIYTIRSVHYGGAVLGFSLICFYLWSKIFALIEIFEAEGVVANERDVLVLCDVTLPVVPEFRE